jgi:hypothetical protein
MTYYNDPFSTSIQCEEHMEVSPEEYAEVMAMMAEEYGAAQGAAEWSASLEEEEPEKDWTGDYSNSTDGPNYGGIDI